MTILTAAVLVLASQGEPMVGWASQYAEGKMEQVVANRQAGCCGRYGLPARLPEVNGFVAMKEPEQIGRVVWLRPLGSSRWERFLVADCAGRTDGGREWMERNGIVVEVDHETAKRWGTVGRGIRVELVFDLGFSIGDFGLPIGDSGSGCGVGVWGCR